MEKKEKKTAKPVSSPAKSASDFEQGEEIELDSAEGGKECAMCHSVPESIVYLSCDHIVCLMCVAKLLLGSQREGREVDFSEVQCGLCEQTTILSKEVQETLLEFLNSAENQDENQADSQQDAEGDGDLDQKESDEQAESAVEEQPPSLRKSKGKHNASVSEAHSQSQSQVSEKAGGFAFVCETHPGEEFVYYYAAKQRLLCAHCLLTEVSPHAIGEVRPIKKCLPEIMNDFQSLFAKTELRSQLLLNRKRDLEIRREHAKKESADALKRLELALDDLAELAQELKVRARKEFETNVEGIFAEVTPLEEGIDERLNYFGSVVESVQNIKDNSENAEEEFFSFFFANQDKIKQALAEEEGEVREGEKSKSYDLFASKAKDLVLGIARETSKTLIEKIGTKLSAPTRPEPARVQSSSRKDFAVERKSMNNSQCPAEIPAYNLMSRLRSVPGAAEADSLRSHETSTLSKTNNMFAKQKCTRFQNLDAKSNYWSSQFNHAARASSSTDVRHLKNMGASPMLSKLSSLGGSQQYSQMKKRELEGKLRLFDLRNNDSFFRHAQGGVGFYKNLGSTAEVTGKSRLNPLFGSVITRK